MFTSEIVVSAASRCLKTINDEIDLPKKLPSNMSARFRVGTSLADACKVKALSSRDSGDGHLGHVNLTQLRACIVGFGIQI